MKYIKTAWETLIALINGEHWDITNPHSEYDTWEDMDSAPQEIKDEYNEYTNEMERAYG